MHCPICGWNNGDFSARCQGCGELLPARAVRTPDRPVAYQTPLTIAFGATSVVSTILLLSLVALITRQDLWPQLINGPEEQVATPIRTPTTMAARVAPTLPAGAVSAFARRAVANLGEAQ